MEMRGRLELANDNAAAFHLAQASARGWEHVRGPGFAAVRCHPEPVEAHRVVVTRPYPDPAALEARLVALFKEWRTEHLCLEDPYGGLDLSRFGCAAGLGQAVMVREPGAAGRAAAVPGRPTAAGLTVHQVADADGLAEVERTVVDGFPVLARLPWQRGGLLPEVLLDLPGHRAWLARWHGAPASACVTYDDGATVGAYWVATLPQHRSKGAARAVLEHALAAHPDRVATLTATLLGEPLYRRMGFREHGVSRWWRFPAAPPVLAAAEDPPRP
ncbi:GNAT family N-acetyltransferase [Kitasatospora sp. NPDC049258]|uniref:GNAT family N-acetyltransferase n=1 Tax=Kitasatospora sp. NPDC049258 TaxID=3155394 RepID=UPI0034451A29